MEQDNRKLKLKIIIPIVVVVIVVIGIMCKDLIVEKNNNKNLTDIKKGASYCNHCKKSKNDINKENGLCKECYNFFWANGNFSMIEYFKKEQENKQEKIEEENRKSVENLVKDNYNYENGYLIPKN